MKPAGCVVALLALSLATSFHRVSGAFYRRRSEHPAPPPRDSHRIRHEHHAAAVGSRPAATQQPDDRDQLQVEELTKQLWKDLGITPQPDMSQVNISQDEYTRMFRLYEKSVRHSQILQQLQDELSELESLDDKNSDGDQAEDDRAEISHHMLLSESAEEEQDDLGRVRGRQKRSSSSLETVQQQEGDDAEIRMRFPLHSILGDELRQPRGDALLLVHSAHLHLSLTPRFPPPASVASEVTLKLRQRVQGEPDMGIVVGSASLKLNHQEEVQVEFDISHTVQVWLTEPAENQGLVLECSSGCHLVASAAPRLEVRMEKRAVPIDVQSLRQKRSASFHSHVLHTKRRNRVDCRAPAADSAADGRRKKPRCCRKQMQVNFSELSGFEHILQPHSFNAYYCDGRCPIRFNPANGHALLQSLLHVESRHERNRDDRIPKPCCAPAKMLPLPILHLSGNSKHKLEVTHWKNVIVGECKCT